MNHDELTRKLETIDEPALAKVTAAFTAARVELFLVGGSVRDLALGLEPKDWDLTTPATPDKIRRILQPLGHLWEAGAEFGTIGVRIGDGDVIEVTSHRGETYRTDDRHPDVTFGATLDADLSRRDLTINAVAFQVAPQTGHVVDPHNGLADLEARVLRTPCDPDITFTDDPLRMLRVVRFAARLDATVDTATAQAVARHRHRLDTVSAERRTAELEHMCSKTVDIAVKSLRLLGTFELGPAVFAGVEVDLDSVADLVSATGDVTLVVAAVTATLDATSKQQVCANMKLSANTARHIHTVDKIVNSDFDPFDDVTVRATARRHGIDATIAAAALAAGADGHRHTTERCSIDSAAINAKLPVDGNDALAAGLKGKDVGAALAAVEHEFCVDPTLDRETALRILAAR